MMIETMMILMREKRVNEGQNANLFRLIDDQITIGLN